MRSLKILPVMCLLLSPAFAAAPTSYLPPSRVKAPADNPTTPLRVDLGKKLFFDPRISGSSWISCASCHNPGLGWADGLPTLIGHGMKSGDRNTPTILNSGFSETQMWDGRFPSLEVQALGPMQAHGEMNGGTLTEITQRVAAIEGYQKAFKHAFPQDPLDEKTIAKAIAAFERTVMSTGTSPFDEWQRGNPKAVSASVKRGFALFTGKANCVACHSGWRFTDDSFQNIGLKPLEGKAVDQGRFAVKPAAALKGAFKTPGLRDIALTAPYMHDGRYATLREVMEHYNRGGDGGDNVSKDVKPLNLSATEIDDLVALMFALTDRKPVSVTYPQLPR